MSITINHQLIAAMSDSSRIMRDMLQSESFAQMARMVDANARIARDILDSALQSQMLPPMVDAANAPTEEVAQPAHERYSVPAPTTGDSQGKKRVRKSTLERRERVKELYAKGYTAIAMADALGAGGSTIRADCKELGLKLR